jgi:hypothetical protein
MTASSIRLRIPTKVISSGFDLMGELLELSAARHHPGEVVEGDLRLLETSLAAPALQQ